MSNMILLKIFLKIYFLIFFFEGGGSFEQNYCFFVQIEDNVSSNDNFGILKTIFLPNKGH